MFSINIGILSYSLNDLPVTLVVQSVKQRGLWVEVIKARADRFGRGRGCFSTPFSAPPSKFVSALSQCLVSWKKYSPVFLVIRQSTLIEDGGEDLIVS